MKRCAKCREEKSLDEFYSDKKQKDGKTVYCKACLTSYRNAHRERSRVYMERRRAQDNEAVKATRRKSWRELDPRKKMLQQCRNRAKRKGLDFNLTLSDIILPEKCPLLGIPFEIGTKDNYEATYSLDRIDPSKGYVKGNIWVLTKKANSMKNSASKQELLTFANNVIKYFGDKDIVRTTEKSVESSDKELVS